MATDRTAPQGTNDNAVPRPPAELEARDLIHLFERQSFTRVEPPILQPLQPFLDLSGEDVRQRMYVTRDLTQLSYPEIGRAFGDRDHTTVMHACRKIEDRMGDRQQISFWCLAPLDQAEG